MEHEEAVEAPQCEMCGKILDEDDALPDLCRDCSASEETHCRGCGQYPENCECDSSD